MFGILKARFTVLKNGIKLHGVDACDKIFFTCCALHNFILSEDEKNDEEDQDEDTEEEVEADGISGGVGRAHEQQPSTAPRNDDLPLGLQPFADENGVIFVNKLDQDYFMKKLIQHHAIQHELQLLKWPKNNGLAPPEVILQHSRDGT